MCLHLHVDAQTPSATFTNPVLEEGADPWVTQFGGFYYYMHTQGDKLSIWKTRDIAALASAEVKVIWKPPVKGANSTSIWAPELHRLDNKWYVYYTATDVDNNSDTTRYVFVLENALSDPMEGEWVDKGKLNMAYSGLDGTVFQLHEITYFIYSAYVGSQSNLIIGKMVNPWTLQDQQVQIASPTFAWEKFGGREILEGPEFLLGKNGKVFIIYSASACWADEYALGMLEADAADNLLDPNVWDKKEEPVFKQSKKINVYGPGHNAFFTANDGTEDWIIYHAKSQPNLQCAHRSPRIQRFSWTGGGVPVFGEPVSIKKKIRRPH